MRRVLALGVLGLALTACGGTTGSLDPIARAANKTAGVATVRFVLDASVDDPTGPISFTATGVLADHGDLWDMHMHVPRTATDPALNMEVVVPPGSTAYMRSSSFRSFMPSGKTWVSYGTDDPNIDIGQNDPTQWLAYLQAVGKVDKIGPDAVRGIETTHYRAEIDFDKVATRIPSDKRKLIKPALDALKGAGVNTLPLEVWVDDGGYVRRLTLDWKVQNPDKASDRFAMRMKMDLFDFGAQVSVPHPTAASAITSGQLMKRINGG